MADATHQRSAMSYSCIAFVHLRNLSQLFCDEDHSAILLDSSCQYVAAGMLTWSGQNAIYQPGNWSSQFDAFDVSNGRTSSAVKPAAKVTCLQQDISDCSVSAWNRDFRMQFVTPVKVFLLKMNAHLAGCVTKTLSLSPKFAHSFINYARYCTRWHAIFPVHNVFFNAVSASESCSDIPRLHAVPTEETIQNTVIVHQSVVVVMTTPQRHELDYQWYDQLIVYFIIKFSVSFH